MTKRADIYLRREGQTLIPISIADAMLLESDYPAGKTLRAKLTYPRSVPFNSRYWVILTKVVENFNDDLRAKYPNRHKLHRALLWKLGYIETCYTLEGVPIVQVDSAAFDKMSGKIFLEYYASAMTTMHSWLGYDPEQWMDEV